MKLPFVSCGTDGNKISRPVEHRIKLEKELYRERGRKEERRMSEGLEEEREEERR